jgi:DNA mismatch repair protein MutS
MSSIGDEGKSQLSPQPVQLALFEPKSHQVVEELKDIDLNHITPLEAINKLDELKKMVE